MSLVSSSSSRAAARAKASDAPRAAATRSELAAALAAPSYPAAWAALFYALCTLVLAYPALGGGFLVNPHSDQYIAGYAFREFAASSLKAGHGIPQWNPYLFGGMPYIAAMHGDIFYPTFLLRMMLPTDVAMTWGFIVHLFLAGLFTYCFLRAYGLGFYASLVGGVAYMLSGQIASLVSPGHDGKLFVSALLPLALWMLVRGVRDGRAWSWGVLALTIGLAVLSPHPQLLQYLLLTCGAFALWLAFGTPDGSAKLDRATALRRLGLALGAVVLGGVIGAIQYLPVREYVAWSPRTGGRGYEYATSFSMPIEELFNTYLPQFTGILDNYWGRNSIHFHSEYLGAVVLMLAGAAFGAGGRRSFRWFWVGTLIVGVLWALGGNTPFYHLVYAIVPGTKFFRAPSTIFSVATFAVAVLAALGVERALAGAVSRRYAIGWLAAGGAIALLATVGGLTAIAQSMAPSVAGAFAGAYPPEQRDAVVNAIVGQIIERAQANNGAVIAGAWRSFLFVALAGGLLLALAQRRIAPRLAAWGLAVLVAADLASIARTYWMFSPPASQLFASDAVIDYLKKAEPGRVIAVPLSDDVQPRDPFFVGDALMAHGIRVVRGYHGNELGRYQKLVPGENAQLKETLWRHENVRYLYTNVPDSTIARMTTGAGGPKFQLVAGPAKNAAGTTVYLYRVPGDNPPAWIATAMTKVNDDQAEQLALDPRFDPSRVAMVDSGAQGIQTQALTALPAPVAATVRAERMEPGHLAYRIDGAVPAGAALVASENYFPGWSATVDGKAAPTARTDFNLIGVPLPAGARRVELTFDDPAYETGKAMTIVALVLAALAVAAGAVMDRRGRVATAAA